MNDDASGGDLPIIDVRSPAERATDAGRAGYERLRTRAQTAPISVLAAMWMAGLTAIVASNTYSVFHFGAGGGAFDDVWSKLTLLAQEGGYGVAVATLAGLALAALSARAVVASALGLLLGAWVVVVGGCGVAASVHGYVFPFSLLGGNRFAVAVAALGGMAMGVVLIGFAWALLTRTPEVAELS
jgi:hypothetical protein